MGFELKTYTTQNIMPVRCLIKEKRPEFLIKIIVKIIMFDQGHFIETTNRLRISRSLTGSV
jgi:hypothetical protein